jgi:NADH-quinone oxidoreductase subunit M
VTSPGAYLLLAVLAMPAIGALAVMLIPKEENGIHLGFGIAFSLVAFFLSLGLIGPFQEGLGSFQLIFDKEWIPGLNAHFKIGIDGISIWLVILTTFLTPLVILSATKAVTKHVREFVVAILILETGMLGAFVALDIFLFYIFWEVMLIPMYLLIGVWGGHRRLYAAIKFVIYTMVGSLLMLVAIFYVYVKHGQVTGNYTTDLEALQMMVLPHDAQIWCFAAFALAFAIKVPLFPLHTWLPDAHVEAPTAGSVILAGVLLKFGVYGFIRYAIPLFPHGADYWAPTIAVLSVIGIGYGAIVAFAQEDVKKLVAYSSVSHLGFCTLGLFAMTAQGVSGSLFAMLSHGLTTGGLFLAIGVIYERRHTRRLTEFGGLWAQMPVFAALFLICVLGSAGLPGLSGFIGEFMTILGTFVADPGSLPQPMLLAALAATGVILGAIYLLYMFQKLMFGPLDNPKNQNLPDLSLREITVFVPIVAMIFAMGFFPQKFLQPMDRAVDSFIQSYEEGLKEPDGPARLKGTPVPDPLAPAEAADDGDAATGETAEAAAPKGTDRADRVRRVAPPPPAGAGGGH